MSQPMPIGVSGPGALSQRTDVQPMSVPTGMPYGDAGAMAQAEQAAPLPQDPSVPAAAAQADASAGAQSGPLLAPPPTLDTPSQRPGEPVTHGADAGPGAGSSILSATPGLPTGGQISQTIAQAAASDSSGLLARLGMIASQRGL